MNVSHDDAEESLKTVQNMMRKTRHSIASSGAYIFLIITGSIWLIGFLATQFLRGPIVAYIWIGITIVGSALSMILGTRMGNRVRSTSVNATAKRAGLFWLLLVLFGVAAVAIAKPTDGKQITMFVILFIMLGQLAMGLILSFSSTWWALPITALALVGYFLFPGIFYLWMGILVGGGMIALALYIHSRW